VLVRLVRSSLSVTVLALAGTGAGFLLQVYLASAFGVGAVTDAYLAATTIPTLANTVFVMALNITFVPVFIEYELKGSRDEAWRVAGSFTLVVLAGLAAASTLGNLASEALVGLVAPGLARDAATLALAASLQRVLLWSLVFMGLSGLLAGLLYAQQSFVVAALGPLLANLIALGVAWAWARPLGIHAVAAGVLAGQIAQAVALLLWVAARYRPRLAFDVGHPGVRQIGRLMLPWLLGAAIYKANPVVDRVIASAFPAGAISILGYAALLAQLAVLASSRGASLSVFPAIARLVSSGQRDQLPALIDIGLRLVVVAVVPVLVLVLLAGDSLVAVLLQRGAFAPADAKLTAVALVAYSGSILALALGNILTYVYYALQDTRTPAIVGSLGMALNVAMALLLRESAGFLAPAVSYSLMALLNLAVLAAVLQRRLGRLVLPGFLAFCARAGLAGLAMAAAVLVARQTLAGVPALAQAPPLVQLAGLSLSGLAAYLLCWALRERGRIGPLLQRIAYRVSA
jgi:putative peptidoglycan lipid II flippase